MNDETPAPADHPEPEAEPRASLDAAAPSDPVPGPEDRPRQQDEVVRRQNRWAAIGLAALIVALAFGGGFVVGRGTAPGGGSPASTPGGSGAAAVSPTPVASQLPSEGPRLGRADAKVTLTVWADFQCPFCARFAQESMPALSSRIADGTLAVVHRDYAFLGDESFDAAVAVRCADRQGRYWPMHDAVYAAQQGENQGAFSRTRLQQIAASVGLDAGTFETCLDERQPLVLVLDDTSAGMRAGVQSTPTVDVNGNRFLGVPDEVALLKAIDDAAAGATPAPEPTGQPLNDPWAGVSLDGRVAGPPDAPVTVELWMDYQAPASAAVANGLEPELRTRIADGSVRVVLRDLATLGDESVAAAALVRCTDEQGGPAWFVHDVLSASGQGQGSGVFVPVTMLRFAARIGLQIAPLSDCLDRPAVASAEQAETAAGTAKGLTTAPAVVVLRGTTEIARFSGELDLAAITKAIDDAAKAD